MDSFKMVNFAINDEENYSNSYLATLFSNGKPLNVKMGYSPLGSPENLKSDILKNPVVVETAEKLGKTPAQVALRWGLQSGHSAVQIILSPIVVARWHGIASWTWDAQDETCGICRMAFDGCCPDCKLPGDDCPLIWGVCNHAFHLHCILKWVNSQTSQAHCPMCRREWQFKG
ncbi:RING-box protein 1 [Vigna radiata var. radiata]|nr:RING-box protein 1 [Vigna radiata var. radiata]